MIDTDKYEGHAKEGWHFDSAHVLRDGYDKEIAELVGEDWLDDEATQKLIADAPVILEAYKELRRQIKTAQGVLEYLYDDELEDAEWIRWFCGMGDEEE
tara:strand:- start:511 stop:807 length:297 start_codon:yes stop_codon:yes gene_type:complete